jgi:acetyl-CoA carboxylase biotin carboxyl carrier protein
MRDIKHLGARLANSGGTKTIHVDAAAIRELADLLDQTGLGEIEIEQAGRRIRVARQSATGAAQVAQHPSVLPEAPIPPRMDARPSTRDGAITSPMVGTVYVSPEPGKPPFVKIGDTIRQGDTLLIVEAMKTMNPIIAPRAGVVQEICVQDAQPVEFGQALMVLSENPS